MKQVCVLGNGQLGRMLRQAGEPLGIAVWPVGLDAEPEAVVLVDFKLEFGKDKDGNLMLADEISPDTCRFWDKSTGDRLDKDRFRKDLGNVLGAYEEIWKRINA